MHISGHVVTFWVTFHGTFHNTFSGLLGSNSAPFRFLTVRRVVVRRLESLVKLKVKVPLMVTSQRMWNVSSAFCPSSPDGVVGSCGATARTHWVISPSKSNPEYSEPSGEAMGPVLQSLVWPWTEIKPATCQSQEQHSTTRSLSWLYLTVQWLVFLIFT